MAKVLSSSKRLILPALLGTAALAFAFASMMVGIVAVFWLASRGD